jgi:hypothetical protein
MLKKSIINGIRKMSESLFLGYSVGAILSDILFTDQIIICEQIKKHSKLIRPFLTNSISEEKFLNQILIMFDKYNHLLEPELVVSIFESLLKYKYISADLLINWYESLSDGNPGSELNIKPSTIDAVYNFLEDVISNEYKY